LECAWAPAPATATPIMVPMTKMDARSEDWPVVVDITPLIVRV